MSSTPGLASPRPSRPEGPHGYGIPETEEGMLPWQHVVSRLEEARHYWVATSGPSCRPHTRPIWGGYIDGSLYVEGGPHTRWARDLAANPAVSVHLESGVDVVVVEGSVEQIRPDDALARRLAESLGAKYEALGYRPTPDQWKEGGLFLVHPVTVFAWTQFPQDVTRFRFD